MPTAKGPRGEQKRGAYSKAAPAKGQTKRTCLGGQVGCKGWLWSDSPGHRQCPTCRRAIDERAKLLSPQAMRPTADSYEKG